MDTQKNNITKITSEKERIEEQIHELKNNDVVKRYFDLCNQNEQLAKQQKDLYKQAKVEEYSSCNHIWVNTFHERDSYERRSYNYHGCIKCGLDEKVFYLRDQIYNIDIFTPEQRIMYDFMQEHSYHNGIVTKIFCNLDLAKAIYSKIKETYPDIDDETAKEYFEIELDKERKTNKAKKLSLNPNFNE